VYGARIGLARKLMHGKKSIIRLDRSCALFHGLPERIDAARYHSLIAVKDTLPEVLQVVAEDEEGEVMAVKHRHYPVYGVQFHPESILTPQGHVIMRNFLSLQGGI
jgi:anthranilate synthase component 2